MRTCAWIVSLISASLLSAGSALARDAGPRRVGVLWFAGTLGPECPVDDDLVAEEVRRIYRHMDIDIEWTSVRQGDAENHGEVIVTAVAANPIQRRSVMGSASTDSSTAWVYCAVIKESLGLPSLGRAESSLLSRAMGRVAAHEIAHILAPGFGHSLGGLMQAKWGTATLRDENLLADRFAREAVGRHLFTLEAPARAAAGMGADLTKGEP
jgi:hypothetical protein